MRNGRALIALASIALLPGCVSQEMIDAERHFEATIPSCSTEKDCEMKWSLARKWMVANPSMKLQHYAADYMETYNPAGDGLGARVIKEPVGETSYRIVVDAWCGGFSCLRSMTSVKQSFNDFVNGKPGSSALKPNPRSPGNPTR
jgi:hypothetical protein